MKSTLHAVAAALLLVCAGCPSETKDPPEKPKKVRPECDTPSTNCYKDCFKRQTSTHCTSCCFDQLILCDEKYEYSFDKCKQEQ